MLPCRVSSAGYGEAGNAAAGDRAPRILRQNDGKQIITAGADKTIKIWNFDTSKVVYDMAGHTSPVTAAVCTNDGKRIASASGDKSIRLWDALTGKDLNIVCNGHQSTVTSIAFNKDGTQLVSGSADKLVKIWDASNGKELLIFRNHVIGVSTVAFSPDGKRVVSGDRLSSLCARRLL